MNRGSLRQGRLRIASPIILEGLAWPLLRPLLPPLSEAAMKVVAWRKEAAGDQMLA